MASQKEISNSKSKDAGWGYRHQQCLLLFCAYIVTFSLKTSIGVGLVAMTKKNRSNTTQFHNASTEFKPEGILNTLMLIPPYPTFNWDKRIQDLIIAAFYWGFLLLQLPSGHLVHRFGAKMLLTATMAINCIVLIMLPIVSYYGSWYCTVVCRVIQGVSQTCVAPSVHTFLGKWTPINERGRMSTLVYGGQAFGIVLGVTLTGLISSSPMGWPGSFRFYGIVSGLMAVVIWFLIYDTPAKHPKISFVEKKYIEDDVGTREKKKIYPVPWLKIIRHRGFHAMVIAQMATLWGNMVLYSEVPAYMDKIMKVNIKANGFLTALPFLVMWFTGFLFSWFTDWLIVKKILSVTNTRKVANSLGYVPAGVGMLALAYVPLNIYIVETLLISICAFKISSICGFLVNYIDVSPNFAGTMISISTFVANIGTSFSPMVIGFILTNVEDQYLWRQVFCLTAGVYLVTNLIYVIFATSARAEWNEPRVNRDGKDVEEVLPMMNDKVCTINHK